MKAKQGYDVVAGSRIIADRLFDAAWPATVLRASSGIQAAQRGARKCAPKVRAEDVKMGHDLRSLWATRKTSGFPWPFSYEGRGRNRARHALFGYPFYAALPVWRQVLGLPGRPWRYARLVRGVARARGQGFRLADLDDVP